MAKQERIEIVLGFTADTQQARTQMQQLQSSIQALGKKSLLGEGSADKTKQELTSIGNELTKFSSVLENSFNQKTGKLDLNKLLVQSKQYGISIQEVKKHLDSLGQTDALNQLNAQIAQGQTGFIQLSKTVSGFAEQLAKTAKLQMSYAVLNNITGTFRSAYNYAQDLNESLTNIRIVTGQSSDQMAEFAKNANQAAQELSATTVAYTDAALIYYQQGLSDQEVEERTNATIKMANVSGQTAADVSSQMTAIWNNFDDGSKSLEYYADVITKLGASTASSSEEIAAGLQQFAAVSDTVGLSYEYATAALATVVAQTRQSADTVGNAFKTIFARLESLNMGDTLDDDTDLTKYTKALEKAGVTVKLQEGQLKNMDDILDQLGEKWESMNDQQKNALAYTVAGARQYTNFIALMDNYDKVQQNIGIARGAEGTLQEQQEIYAESWEAAAKRLKAAWEDIFTQLVDDKAFIAITNGLATIVEAFGNLIENIGGLKTVLPLAVSLVSILAGSSVEKAFTSIQKTAESAKIAITGADETLQGEASEALKIAAENSSTEAGLEREILEKRVEAQRKLVEAEKQSNGELRTSVELGLKALRTAEEQTNLAKQKALDFTDEHGAAVGAIPLYKANNKVIEKLNESNFPNFDDFLRDNPMLSSSVISKIRQAQASQKPVDEQHLEVIAALKAENAAYMQTIRASAQQIQSNKNVQQSNAQVAQSVNAETEAINNNAEAQTIENETTEQSVQADSQATESAENHANAMMEDAEAIEIVTNAMREKNQAVTDAQNSEKGTIEGILGTDDEDKFAKRSKSWNSLLLSFMSLSAAINNVYSATAEFEKGNLKLGTALSSLPTIAFGATGAMKLLGGSIKEGKVLFEAGTAGANLFGGSIGGLLTKVSGFAPVVAEGGAVTGAFASTLAGAIPVIGIAVAAVAALSYAFIKIKNSSPEETLKRIKKTTSELEGAAEDAANKYDSLKDSIDSLKGQEEELKELTKGTDEWNKAVKDLNEQYRELIENNNLINGKDWYVDSEGRYRIYDLEKVEQDSLSKKAGTALAADAGNLAIAQRELDKDRIDIIGELSNLLMNRGYNAEDVIEKSSTLGVDQIIKDEIQNFQTLMQVTKDEGLIKEYSDYIEELMSIQERYNESLALGAENFQQAVFDIIDANEEFDSQDYGKIEAALKNAYTTENLNQITIDEDLKKNFAKAEGYEYKNGNFYTVDDEGKETLQKIDDDILQGYGLLSNLSSTLNFAETGAEYGEATLEDLTQSDSSFEAQEKAIDVSDTEAEVYKDLLIQKAGIINANKEQERVYKSLALRQMELNQGLADLSDSWDDYCEVFEESGTDFSRSSAEYAKGLAAIRENLQTVFEVDVSTSFIQDHLEDIEKLAKGDISVFEELGVAAAQDYVAHLDLQDGVYVDKDGNEHPFTAEEVRGSLQEVIDGLSQDLTNIEIGTTLDDSEYIDTLNEMLRQGQITADQANSILASIGYDADIETEKVPVKHTYKYEGKIGDQDVTGEITSEEEVDVPVINGSTTTYVGGRNAIDASNRTGGSNTSKGTKSDQGKSSGSSKTKTAERYHTISKQIKSVENDLSELDDAMNKAFGQEKLQLMDEQIKKYDELDAALEEYGNQIQANYLKDQALMNGYGAKYDKYGNIINYDEIFAAHGQEEGFDEALKNYEKDLEDWNSNNTKRRKNKEAKYSKELEKITYAVEYKVEIDDTKLKRLDWLLKNLDDDTYDLAESMANLNQQAGLVEDQMNATLTGLEDWRKFHSEISDDDWAAYMAGTMSAKEMANKLGNLTDAERKQLEKWSNDLMSSYDKLKEISDTLQDDIVKSFQKFSEVIDDQTNSLEHLNKMLSSYKNIINLTGQKELGITKDMMNAIRQQGIDIALAEEEVATAGYQSAKKEYMEALADPAVKQETLDELKKTLDSMEEKWISSLENTLQMAKDRFKEILEDIVNEFEEKMGGVFGTLSNMSDMFDKQNTLDDLYLKTYEQSYELSKLMRQLDKSIDDSSNIKNRQKLMELQQEITDIQESGKEINEYDLEVLQKKYDLYLAQIALEDARAAKSQVRMTRDNEGNMSYIYTADMSAVDDANQNYEDKLYDLEKVTQDRQGAMQAQMLQEWQNYEDAISQLDVSDRERGEMLKAYWEELNEKYSGFLQDSLDDANWVVEELGVADDQLVNKWDETVLAYVTGFDTLGDLNNNFLDSSKAMFDDLQKQYVAYDSTVDAAYTAAGLSTTNFTNTINEELGNVQKDMDETTQKANEFSEDFSDAFNRALGEVDKFASEHAQYMENARQEIDSVVSKLGDLIDAYGSLGSAAEDAYQQLLRTNELANQTPSGGTPTTGSDNVDSKVDNSKETHSYSVVLTDSSGKVLTSTTGIKTGEILLKRFESALKSYNATFKNTATSLQIKKDNSILKTYNPDTVWKYYSGDTAASDTQWRKIMNYISSLESLDTGGYTGQWGAYGRLAMLHEKEIVLNKEDTKNFLEGIGILREIDNGYSNLRQYADAIMSTGTVNNGPAEIQQTVTINADFPGVSSQYEIESAFENLFSRASQYVNRKV